MKENNENKLLTKLTVFGALLFIFGIFVGNNVNFNSIQSFLSNPFTRGWPPQGPPALPSGPNATWGNATWGNATWGNATWGNATWGNATWGNATRPNATWGNATRPNATCANATCANASCANATGGNAGCCVNCCGNPINDNIIYVQSFSMSGEKVKPGESVGIKLVTTGANLNSAIISFENNSIGTTVHLNVENINSDSQYLMVPENITPATYSFKSILLVGKNSNCKTFSKVYTNDNYKYNLIVGQNTIEQVDENGKVDVVAVPDIELNDISLENTSVKPNDKVFVKIGTNQTLKSARLTFVNDKQSLYLNVKDVESDNPYVLIPTYTKEGKYKLKAVVLTTENNSTMYTLDSKDKKLKQNIELEVVVNEEKPTEIIYNNEDITYEEIANIYKEASETDIVVDASTNAIIDEELFNLIKGKNRGLVINSGDNQMIFDGNSITNSKAINADIVVVDVSKIADINQLVNDGIVVKFSDNGDLPGEALIRIKATESVASVLKNNPHVYYYNENDRNFTTISDDVKKTSDGYYEFTITHNSSYLLTSEKIDSSLIVASANDKVVSFQESNTVHILMIIIGLLLAAVITIVMLTLRNKKKENQA